MKKIEIGSHEAETSLPELLRKVRQGQRFTINHRGKAVAELVPVEDAVASRARQAAADMRDFMDTAGTNGAPAIDDEQLKSWIGAGRR